MRNEFFLILFILASGCVKKASTTAKTEPTPAPVAPQTTPNPTPVATTPPIVSAPDPLAYQAWHLVNTGQKTYASNGGVIGVDLNMSMVTSSGAGVLVAVSDDGVQTSHPDLNINLGFSKNYSLASPWFGDPTPDSAHGTAVSGIIGAKRNNGLGSRGIASSSIVAGFRYIGTSYSLSKQVDQANGNYDIFNYSYGGYSCYFDYSPTSYIAQLEYGAKNLRGGKGAIYVKAAGNEFYSMASDCDSSLSSEDDYYYFGNANLEEVHSYPWSIVTAAVNASGVSSSYSTPGSSLWISGLGGEFGVNYPAILTTDLTGCNAGYAKDGATRNTFEDGSLENSNCDYTSAMNGTSAATPTVTAAVAHLLEVNPNLSWRDVKYILAKTARKIDPLRGNTSHPAGYNLTGHVYQLGWITNAAGFNFHNWYGFGVVDLLAATNLARNYNVNLGTFVEAQVASANNLNLDIPDNAASGVTHQVTFNQSRTIEAVQIKLNVTHSWVGDLGVELTSPSGTKSILMNINSGVGVTDIEDEVLLTNAFYGEPSLGTWTLKIVDGLGEDVGKLNQWTLKIYGR